MQCYIEVTENTKHGYVDTCYGSYVDRGEAETNLRHRGWEQHPTVTGLWGGPVYDGKVAHIRDLPPLKPRNQLPRHHPK